MYSICIFCRFVPSSCNGERSSVSIIDMLSYKRSVIIISTFLLNPCNHIHYMKKPHPRCARTKNGDAGITHLCCYILHYRVIGDARPGASPISIHGRCTKLERVFDYKTHLRRALMVHVTNLILGWCPCGTNMRRAQGHKSPITLKSKTCIILAHRRFNCRLGSL
jgi:hypothetical protein